MQIRQAELTDAAAISGLIRPLAEKYIAHELSAEGAGNLLGSLSAEAIERYLRAGFRYFVAEEEGVLVGVVATRDEQHLYHLFVSEERQRQGLARTLWEVAKSACLAAGSTGTFTVNSSRYAVRLYRKLGFAETSLPVEQNGVVFVPMRMGES